MAKIGPNEISHELELIVVEFGHSDEYLQGISSLLDLWHRRSMMSDEMQNNMERELVYHYENIKENTEITEEEYQPPVRKHRKMEWLNE